MELGDTNTPQTPYAPRPPVPFKFLFLCEPDESSDNALLNRRVRERWHRWVSGTEFIEDPERWDECKGMVFYFENYFSPLIAQMMLNFLGRDRGESLLYQFDPVSGIFVDRNELWLKLRI